MVHGFECNACKCVDDIYQMHWIMNAPNSPHFQYSVLIMISCSYYDEILNFVPPIEISITYLSSFLCLIFFKWFKFILYVLIFLYESKINRLWAQYIYSELSFFPLHSCNAYTFILLWTNKFSIFFFLTFLWFFRYQYKSHTFKIKEKYSISFFWRMFIAYFRASSSFYILCFDLDHKKIYFKQ